MDLLAAVPVGGGDEMVLASSTQFETENAAEKTIDAIGDGLKSVGSWFSKDAGG